VNVKTVDLYWFRLSTGDRVITLHPVGVSLCVRLIVLYRLLFTGVLTASLYIGRESCGAVTILVRSKEGVLN
jgi:hypothetical protein